MSGELVQIRQGLGRADVRVAIQVRTLGREPGRREGVGALLHGAPTNHTWFLARSDIRPEARSRSGGEPVTSEHPDVPSTTWQNSTDEERAACGERESPSDSKGGPDTDTSGRE